MSLVVHFEIHAAEPQRCIDFYSALFGWTFTQFGDTYWVIDTGDRSVKVDEPGFGINGGLVQRMGPDPEVGSPVTGANLVIGTDRVDELFARGIELGGIEALPLTDYPHVGRLGYLLDPAHNVFGIITPEM